MSARDTRYFAVLGIAVAVIIVAGTGRFMANAAAEELKSQTSAVDPVQLETLAAYLRPVPLTAAPALVEPMPTAREPDNELFDFPDERAPVARAPARPRWVVSTILIADTRRMAVLNDELVTIGSTIPGGGRVTAIEADHIVLTEPGGTRRVLRVAATN